MWLWVRMGGGGRAFAVPCVRQLRAELEALQAEERALDAALLAAAQGSAAVRARARALVADLSVAALGAP